VGSVSGGFNPEAAHQPCGPRIRPIPDPPRIAPERHLCIEETATCHPSSSPFFLISCLRVPACLQPIIRPLAKGLKRANEVLAIEGNWEASEAGNKSVQECSCVALDQKTATEKTNTYETYIHVYITGLHGQYLTSDFLAHCILSTAPPPHPQTQC
jgi:hypothetical protein